MKICFVNGVALEPAVGLETWGQLLVSLELGEGAERTVVAAVRFGGVDQPTFRAPEVLALDLEIAAPIEVKVCTRGELINSARDLAFGALDALATAARQSADAFRLHDLPRAHQSLAEFVSSFQQLTMLTAAVGCVDSSCQTSTIDDRGAILDRMNVSLGALIDFDVNEDWISVADVLEYEIADLLPHWGAVISVAHTPDCSGDRIAVGGQHA